MISAFSKIRMKLPENVIRTMDKVKIFEQFQCYGQPPEEEGAETVLTLPGTIGEGYRREISLGPGLRLYLERYSLKERLRARVVSEYSPLGITICMSGRLNWTPDCHGPVLPYPVLPGHFDMFVPGQDQEIGVIECMPREPILLVSLLIEPANLPYKTAGKSIQQNLSYFNTAPSNLFSLVKHRLTPSMHMAARQLMNCRFTGTTKTIYLTSKVLELIALVMDQCNAAPFPPPRHDHHGRPPCRRELDRLHQVRRILNSQYPAPPSLKSLARQTGLNQTKLKKGFKHLFHTTISSYVLSRRMEKGRELLEKGDTTVSEVAYRVGYANSAHFTRAFTRQFGYPPVHLLRQTTSRDNQHQARASVEKGSKKIAIL